jgi:hypothetical protein
VSDLDAGDYANSLNGRSKFGSRAKYEEQRKKDMAAEAEALQERALQRLLLREAEKEAEKKKASKDSDDESGLSDSGSESGLSDVESDDRDADDADKIAATPSSPSEAKRTSVSSEKASQKDVQERPSERSAKRLSEVSQKRPSEAMSKALSETIEKRLSLEMSKQDTSEVPIGIVAKRLSALMSKTASGTAWTTVLSEKNRCQDTSRGRSPRGGEERDTLDTSGGICVVYPGIDDHLAPEMHPPADRIAPTLDKDALVGNGIKPVQRKVRLSI